MGNRLPFALVFVVGLAGCGVTDFEVSQDIEEQTIPGSALPELLGQFFEFPLELDIRGEIEAMETGPIDGVYLSGLSLTITETATSAGDSDDWSFVRTVDVFIASSVEGSALPQVKVATATDPGAATVMSFVPVAGLNLLPYVNEGSVMTAEADADAPPDDVSYLGRAVFRVEPL